VLRRAAAVERVGCIGGSVEGGALDRAMQARGVRRQDAKWIDREARRIEGEVVEGGNLEGLCRALGEGSLVGVVS
jgi:hypothetical protein